MNRSSQSFYACSLIDQLVAQGVRHFCIAPGSRSTTLALAAAYHPRAHIHVHFDERGLGFYALGLAQGSGSPVAVIVSSGSAVGNLLPAVMEAANSFLPLILLTSDRPPELRQCGANQTADQVKLFDPFVCWQFDFPPPDASCGHDFLRSQAAQAVGHSRDGPVHLNCMFREPLWEGVPAPYPTQPEIFLERPQLSLPVTSHARWNELLDSKTEGVIFIGRLQKREHLVPIFHLAKQLGWPIFADLLSQARGLPQPAELITYFHWILKHETFAPDCILHFGDRFISKTLLEKLPQITYLHIHEGNSLHDPSHRQTARLQVDPVSFVEAIHIHKAPTDWLQRWQRLNHKMQSLMETVFQKHSFSEAEAMRCLSTLLPHGWDLFLGTSMPVREADAFLGPIEGTRFYSNRGTSGIDGTIATAVGICEGSGRPLLAFIGDQAVLHDLNSLALLQRCHIPCVLVISNNFGGGIFSHLPIAQQTVHFETLFTAKHSVTFQPAAEMFSLPYKAVRTRDSFCEGLSKIFQQKTSAVMEFIHSTEVNLQVHECAAGFLLSN